MENNKVFYWEHKYYRKIIAKGAYMESDLGYPELGKAKRKCTHETAKLFRNATEGNPYNIWSGQEWYGMAACKPEDQYGWSKAIYDKQGQVEHALSLYILTQEEYDNIVHGKAIIDIFTERTRKQIIEARKKRFQ